MLLCILSTFFIYLNGSRKHCYRRLYLLADITAVIRQSKTQSQICDHRRYQPRNVMESESCQVNVRKLVKRQGNVREMSEGLVRPHLGYYSHTWTLLCSKKFLSQEGMVPVDYKWRMVPVQEVEWCHIGVIHVIKDFAKINHKTSYINIMLLLLYFVIILLVCMMLVTASGNRVAKSQGNVREFHTS